MIPVYLFLDGCFSWQQLKQQLRQQLRHGLFVGVWVLKYEQELPL